MFGQKKQYGFEECIIIPKELYDKFRKSNEGPSSKSVDIIKRKDLPSDLKMKLFNQARWIENTTATAKASSAPTITATANQNLKMGTLKYDDSKTKDQHEVVTNNRRNDEEQIEQDEEENTEDDSVESQEDEDEVTLLGDQLIITPRHKSVRPKVVKESPTTADQPKWTSYDEDVDQESNSSDSEYASVDEEFGFEEGNSNGTPPLPHDHMPWPTTTRELDEERQLNARTNVSPIAQRTRDRQATVATRTRKRQELRSSRYHSPQAQITRYIADSWRRGRRKTPYN